MSQPTRRRDIKCPTCQQSFRYPAEYTFFPSIDMKELVQNKSTNQKIAFKKLFCALLNMQEANLVIFHVDNFRIVDTYDNDNNDILKSLVPGACAYSDRFERHDLDAHHFLVRVKPSIDTETCILSTLDFHTCFSQDGGLDSNPTHSTMQQLLKRETHGADMVQTLPKRDDFILDQEVRIGEIPFTENLYRQAKGAQNNTNGKVPKYWKKKLQKYISAFSKVPGGGTVYYGVNEEKETPYSQLKKFICKGVHLNKASRDQWRTFCNIKAREMLWVTRKQTRSTPAIQVDFIRPRNATEECCVIIVTVPQFQGVGFLRKEGPESYTLEKNDNPTEVKPWAKWARLSHCEDLVDVNE